MEKIIQKLKRNWLYLLGGVIGAGGGYIYWYYIGCTSGTCPITSSPYASVVWGAILGGLLFSMFNKDEE